LKFDFFFRYAGIINSCIIIIMKGVRWGEKEFQHRLDLSPPFGHGKSRRQWSTGVTGNWTPGGWNAGGNIGYESGNFKAGLSGGYDSNKGWGAGFSLSYKW
jgi:hypothetical protein